MADDRMKDDDLQRNMGAGGHDDKDRNQGQQSPGRNPQGGQQTGGYGGQQGGQKNQPSNLDDDEEIGGGGGQRGDQGRGGQNR